MEESTPKYHRCKSMREHTYLWQRGIKPFFTEVEEGSSDKVNWFYWQSPELQKALEGLASREGREQRTPLYFATNAWIAATLIKDGFSVIGAMPSAQFAGSTALLFQKTPELEDELQKVKVKGIC
ncbi:hypothetical protein [Enterococcus sp.]|uniref:hypothetical protein n=1 Tax=Enterococcus sp. TaxID=35783 RepID=UPI0028A15666|nr:hypothetical protein [Enterococcus sp.]